MWTHWGHTEHLGTQGWLWHRDAHMVPESKNPIWGSVGAWVGHISTYKMGPKLLLGDHRQGHTRGWGPMRYRGVGSDPKLRSAIPSDIGIQALIPN